jgi:hypothetical protein
MVCSDEHFVWGEFTQAGVCRFWVLRSGVKTSVGLNSPKCAFLGTAIAFWKAKKGLVL